jgi:hypothetical protein
VHSQIDVPLQQRRLDISHKDTFAAQHGKRVAAVAVARRANHHHIRLQTGMMAPQGGGDPMRLPQRQRAATRAETDPIR